MDNGAGDHHEQRGEPIPAGLLADLQAGLLDDAAAARLRARARADPHAARVLAALDRVRRELAELGADEASAPEVPAAVLARMSAALHAAPPRPAGHAVRPALPRRWRLIAAVAGVAAALIAVAIGVRTLLWAPTPAPSPEPTAQRITVSAREIPLSDAQIVGLLERPPDYGSLADPGRRASCLRGLGYSSATAVLGARPLDVRGQPGVVLLLSGDTPTSVVALVVGPDCNSADPGLLADTVVSRP